MREIAQRDDIRDLLLDEVDLLLAQVGYKKMTMEDLARRVGIGKGTIYLHFRSKEELTLCHIDRIVEKMLQELELTVQSKKTVKERFHKMLVTRVMYRFDSVQHYSQSLSDLLSALRPALLARRQNHFEKESVLFAKVLEDGRKSGTLRFKNAKDTARLVLTATNSLLPYNLSPKEIGKRSYVEAQVSVLAELLWKGLLR